ncbi:MAG TPA: cobyrinate a,c-diamide synthase [Rhodospirillales bacterium]|nr:cobyrinate a,c-diamide synthase [Rhodospirillales bacterium]
MSHLLISAASKSSGKTTVTLGLSAALRERGIKVQTFKKGPDYIDPSWLSVASGRPCRNLDYNTMGADEIGAVFARHDGAADVSLIEGTKGLFDGLDPKGGDCTAALAAQLGAPVVLVFDAEGVTRGVAPLILGYRAFAPEINFAGVIINKVAGARHEKKLRAAIERYTDLPMLGAVWRCPEIEINERHLGLIPPNESAEAKDRIAAIAEKVAGRVDLDSLLEKAAPAPSAPTDAADYKSPPGRADVRIGLARDAAFGFYYADDLEGLRTAGAEVVEFNALRDAALPEVDGLFIGGGFPETQMAALEANAPLKRAIRDAIEGGMPAFAECGGLMYLAKSITWNGERREMAGVIDADAVMHKQPVGKGYVRVRETGLSPWPLLDAKGRLAEFPAHEFHYSTLENMKGDYRFAYEMLRGEGLGKTRDGIVHKNLLASFIHQRDVESNRWTKRFVDFVRSKKQGAA